MKHEAPCTFARSSRSFPKIVDGVHGGGRNEKREGMGDEEASAKFAYVTIGDKDNKPFKVMVNVTCGTESISDFARASLLKQVDARIAEETLAKSFAPSPVLAAVENSAEEGGENTEEPVGGEEEAAAPPVDQVEVLTQLREKLVSTDTKLTDEGCTVAIGAEEKLEARMGYSMALFGMTEPEEEGQEPEQTISPLLTSSAPA